MKPIPALTLAAALLGATLLPGASAQAAPAGAVLGVLEAGKPVVETVAARRKVVRRKGRGAALAAGVIGAAIVGGAIIAQSQREHEYERNYYYGNGYYGAPGYYPAQGYYGGGGYYDGTGYVSPRVMRQKNSRVVGDPLENQPDYVRRSYEANPYYNGGRYQRPSSGGRDPAGGGYMP